MYVCSESCKCSVLVAVVALAVVMSGQRAQAQPGWVLSHQKISATEGGFTGTLDDVDLFGVSAASLGDLDGDGIGDLAVGARLDDDGDEGFNRGAVWILFLNDDGTVKSHQKISDTEGNFTGILADKDNFGHSVAALGDLDGDGVGDLAVGAVQDDDGGTPPDANRGAVWILFLNTDGTVKSHQKISDTEGGFTGKLDDGDLFSHSLTALGDLDGDGSSVLALAVGAVWDDDGGGGNNNRGAVWILFLNSNGTVDYHQKISSTQGDGPPLDNFDNFGMAAASLGDLDGDGLADLAVGASSDDDGGDGCGLACNRGAVWIQFLNDDGTVKSDQTQKISDTEGGGPPLDNVDLFGHTVGFLDDLDGDGVGDLAVGAIWDDDGCKELPDCNRGAAWILFLNDDGTVKSDQKISDTQGGFTGTLDDFDRFGFSAAALGDLDGDGSRSLALAVGAWGDDDGGTDRGAVWILFLDGICLWDLDANGSIGVSDLLALLADWGPCKGCPADFDDDGSVGVSDLLALLANWGPCP